jgi:hypothetical protein
MSTEEFSEELNYFVQGDWIQQLLNLLSGDLSHDRIATAKSQLKMWAKMGTPDMQGRQRVNRYFRGCLFAVPGVGDCEHAVGLPGKSIPGRHDGPDDTVDEYGRPNGWCEVCWLRHQLQYALDELYVYAKTRGGTRYAEGVVTLVKSEPSKQLIHRCHQLEKNGGFGELGENDE